MGPHASLSEAARASKTAWRTLMGWRATDLMFQAHLEDLELAKEEELGDLLEKELISRATEGVDTPLVSMGKIVATVKKKSDTLLLEAVRAKRRQYRRAQQAASAEVGRDAEGQPFVKVYAGFDPDQV